MSQNNKLIDDYATMLLIRRFEETVDELFTTGVVAGTVHTCVGQEAVAVGVASALQKTDVVTSNHRGHGHFIAKGGDIRRMMAEMFGKADGYSGGRGGSQLMADYKLGFMGGNGIVGGSIPLAAGMALRFKQRKKSNIAACFIGDGAVNQGTFHETLNMAALWKLPVLFLCENNLYAMSTPVAEGNANADFAGRACSYGMPGISVDGNDYFAVREIVREYAERARNGEGPAFIEFKTYRFSGHSRGDQRLYRSREEENFWQRKGPLRRMKKHLIKNNIMTEEDDRQIKKTVRAKVQDAVKFSKSSPYPKEETLLKGVYV
jgi:pyruvate dehydrogenase E1 component alpha subunit